MAYISPMGFCVIMCFISSYISMIRADSRSAPSRWEKVLYCNAVSHWLGANLESAMWITARDAAVTILRWMVLYHGMPQLVYIFPFAVTDGAQHTHAGHVSPFTKALVCSCRVLTLSGLFEWCILTWIRHWFVPPLLIRRLLSEYDVRWWWNALHIERIIRIYYVQNFKYHM